MPPLVGSKSRLPSSPVFLALVLIFFFVWIQWQEDESVYELVLGALLSQCLCVVTRWGDLCSAEFCSAEISLVEDAFCDASTCIIRLFRGANIVAAISLVVAFRDASTCIVRLLRGANIAAAISLVVDVFRNASTCLTASYKNQRFPQCALGFIPLVQKHSVLTS